MKKKIVKTYDELVVGQPLDGINNLGATWAGTNVAVGAAEDKSLPLDLLEVELANDAGQKHISFLGVTIGLIADCDIGSISTMSMEINKNFQTKANTYSIDHKNTLNSFFNIFGGSF